MKQLLLLFLPLTVFSQTSETTQKRAFWLGLSFSPDLAHRTTVSENDVVENTYDHIETSKFGYTGGVNILFEINSGLELETGIQYSWKGFKIKERTFIAEQPGDPAIPERGWFEYRYPYLDAPLKLNYKPFKNRKFFFSGGLIAHFYLQSSTKFVAFYAGGRKEETVQYSTDDDYKKITLGFVAGFGRDFNFGKNSKLRIEPLFRHIFLPIHPGSVKYYLWTAGLNVGFYKRLH